MDKELLTGYRKDVKELRAINKALEKLYDRADNIPVVCGKVSASGSSFPYIEGHMTVQMVEPRENDKIQKRIRDKKKRRNELNERVGLVEKFISDMPDGVDKEIFEMLFLDGMSQKEVGESVGLERSSVSKRVERYLLTV